MNIIDLRSDTVTKPGPALRKAMSEAEVGDDVYGEDPTVNRLEVKTADLLGKEAALFVSSGSMGNLIALYLHAGKGGEVLAHEDSHIIHYEVASGAALAGCQILSVPGERGILRPEALRSKVRAPSYMNARTRLLEVENTGNLAGGTVYTLEELKTLEIWARQEKLSVHLDGARIWNACVALGKPVKELAAFADSASVCLSKGLGAPVGSLLVGTKDFIFEARRVRKMLGGGMRQSGILAAAGIYVLDHHRERLHEDHEHALKLAAAIRETSWARVSRAPETNILFASTPGKSAHAIAEQLKEKGLLCSALSEESLRFVTHLDVDAQQIAKACSMLKEFKIAN